MLKKTMWIVVLIIGIIFPIEALAECSNTEKIKYASLAQNISVTYDYVETNGQVSFNIILTNLQPGLKVKDVFNNIEYPYTSNELILYGYMPNTNYRFDIYSTTCTNRLYSHYVTLPGYNPYYNDPICIGVTHSLCQKWTNMKYDYNTFIQEVTKIKQKTNIEVQEEQQEEVKGVYDYITEFFISYYYIILPAIIIICTIIIIVKRKKEDLF